MAVKEQDGGRPRAPDGTASVRQQGERWDLLAAERGLGWAKREMITFSCLSDGLARRDR